MHTTRTIAFFALVAAAGCQRGESPNSETPSTEEAPTQNAESASHAAGAACEQAALLLSTPPTPPALSLDIEDARAQLAAADFRSVIATLEWVAGHGAGAAELAPDIERHLNANQLPIAQAAFDALAAVDPQRAQELGAEIAQDADRPIADRMMAAHVVGTLGEEGLRALTALGATAPDSERAAILDGIRAADRMPLLARNVLFDGDGAFCTDSPTEVCEDMRRHLGVAWPSLLDGARLPALAEAEQAAALTGDADAWRAAFSVASTDLPIAAAESLARLQALGIRDGLDEAALRCALDTRLSERVRSRQALWLLERGAEIDALAERLTEASGAGTDAGATLLAIAAGGEVSTEDVDLLRRFAAHGTGAIGLTARLATTHALGEPVPGASEIPGIAPVLTAIADGDMTALATALTAPTIDPRLPLDAATIGAAGRRDAFAAALMADTIEPSAHALEVAARGTVPTAELTAKFAPALDASTLSTTAARWLVEGGQRDAVQAAAEAALADPSTTQRWRATQWALAAGASLSGDGLRAALVAPDAANEIAPPVARTGVLLRLLHVAPPSLDQATALLEQAREGGRATREASIALAHSYHAHCETP